MCMCICTWCAPICCHGDAGGCAMPAAATPPSRKHIMKTGGMQGFDAPAVFAARDLDLVADQVEGINVSPLVHAPVDCHSHNSHVSGTPQVAVVWKSTLELNASSQSSSRTEVPRTCSDVHRRPAHVQCMGHSFAMGRTRWLTATVPSQDHAVVRQGPAVGCLTGAATHICRSAHSTRSRCPTPRPTPAAAL